MFENMEYVKLKFTLVCKERVILNQYKGSALRGGFGEVFRDITCINKEKECIECESKNQCIFAYVFRSVVPDGKSERSATVSMPVPFIIEPPMSNKNIIESGELFEFKIIIIGKAIDYLTYFIYCFDELGKVGLGKNYGKYEILSITCDNSNRVIFHNSVLDLEKVLVKNFIFDEYDVNKLNVKFLTPFKALKNGKLVKNIDFELILRNLLRRIGLIMNFHYGMKLELDFKYLINESRGIKVKSSDLNCYEWERQSRITKKPIYMDGFIGSITFEGELTKFMNFIKIGEIIHIGKGCSFGMGKYKVSTF